MTLVSSLGQRPLRFRFLSSWGESLYDIPLRFRPPFSEGESLYDLGFLSSRGESFTTRFLLEIHRVCLRHEGGHPSGDSRIGSGHHRWDPIRVYNCSEIPFLPTRGSDQRTHALGYTFELPATLLFL